MAKPERWCAVFDTHGHHICPKAAGVFFDFMKAWKPTVKIHGGDAFDWAALRRGASDEEKRESLRDDLDAGLAFFDRFKPTHYLRGNHCERLHDAASSDDGPLADLGNGFLGQIEDALVGVRQFPYHKRHGVFRYGDTSFLHGYHAGVYAARNAAMVYGKCVLGHVHASDQITIPRLENATGYTIGALCQLDQRYNRAQAGTLRQNQGWAYGLKIGEVVVVYSAKAEAGQWILPVAFDTYKA